MEKNKQYHSRRDNIEKIIRRAMLILYPVIFFESMFANMFSFYVTLGNKIEWLRKVISWGLIVCVFVLAIAYVIFCVRNKRRYIAVLIIPTVIYGGLVFSFFYNDMDSAMLKQLILSGLYCVPALIFAAYAVIEKVEKKIFDSFIYAGVFMFPGYVMFLGHSISGWKNGESWNNFGGMGYLGLGYSAAFLFAGMMISILWGETKNNLKQSVLYSLVMTVCVLVVVFGGARGALLGIVVFVLLVVLAMIIRRYKNKKMYVVPLAAGAIIAIALCGGNETSLGTERFFSLIAEMTDGTFLSVLSSDESDRILENMENAASEGKDNVFSKDELLSMNENISHADNVIGEVVESKPIGSESIGSESIESESIESELIENESIENEPIESESIESKPIENELVVSEPIESESIESKPIENELVVSEPIESEPTQELVESITNGSMARVYLYKLAINEIRKNPIGGMGVYGYQSKYGVYPHNIVLHIIVDFGILFSTLMFSYLLYCFVCAIRKDDKWSNVGVILFCCILGVSLMLSGSLYQSVEFMWIITYFQTKAITKKCSDLTIKKHEKTNEIEC